MSEWIRVWHGDELVGLVRRDHLEALRTARFASDGREEDAGGSLEADSVSDIEHLLDAIGLARSAA